nr:dienelactone hydrolase family protein [Sphingomonas sp. CDS-1]
MSIETTKDGLPLIEGLPDGENGAAMPPFRPLATPPEPILLKAADGDCPAYLFKPSGAGPWPAVLFLMDGFGMRPNLMEMAQRLADGGYLVLLPDLFYRRGVYEPLDVPKIFAGGNLREDVFAALGASPTNVMIAADAAAFLGFIKAHPDFAGGRIGVTGYCMSGGMSLTIAGTYPDDIAAAACFHGGMLVCDSDISPHHWVGAIQGEVYVGGAQTDEWCPPEMVSELDRLLTAANIDHRCEIYRNTLHGWTMRDSAVYNEAAAERHWHELFTLFARAFSQPDSMLGGVF